MPLYRMSPRSLVLVGALLATSMPAQAKDDFITLDIGAYRFRSRDDISVGGTTTRGTNFNMEREGTPDNDSVVRIDGTLRFAPRHRMRFMFFDSKRSGPGILDRDITFRDSTYTLGSRVDTSFEMQQLELDYMYSFYKTEQLEWAASLGVHASHMVARLTAPALSLDKEASATGPLPMVGVAVNWKPKEKWELFGHVYGMHAQINEYGGTALAYRGGVRYFFTPNIGIGLAYAGINYHFNVDRTSWLGDLNASHKGGQAFLALRF